ncbi:GTP pyrophosphokinase [Bacillus cereus]|uniref:GTP pyrophosphokinase n=1 Tax=Bacillus cereus TaxID=1396 RepID=UPI000BFB3648|nr:GTP pyrophosphokinase [Bacillus cereus]PGY06520.1 GTP pyrophosphokinase [Bacillus cereus]
MVEKVERLISEINKLHKQYSNDYFDTGKVDKVNLSRTIKNVPERHILNYRLNLHESINDYLMKADTDDIKYFYRVKTSESILDKINRYLSHTDQYPVNNWLNDIFGCRMILSADEIEEIETHLGDWQEKYGLKNWYHRRKDGYNGVHIYFKNRSNFYFPWELQLWDKNDVESNIEAHRKHKRNFV